MHSRGGYVSQILYAKTKESGPLGGVCRARPLNLPMIGDVAMLIRFQICRLMYWILYKWLLDKGPMYYHVIYNTCSTLKYILHLHTRNLDVSFYYSMDRASMELYQFFAFRLKGPIVEYACDRAE